MKVKGPTEVKQGGGQQIFFASGSLNHFQNDGAAVKYITLVVLLQIQLAMLLELKKVKEEWRKGKGQRRALLKRNAHWKGVSHSGWHRLCS